MNRSRPRVSRRVVTVSVMPTIGLAPFHLAEQRGSIIADVAVDLPAERDQISTRALSAFVTTRTTVARCLGHGTGSLLAVAEPPPSRDDQWRQVDSDWPGA